MPIGSIRVLTMRYGYGEEAAPEDEPYADDTYVVDDVEEAAGIIDAEGCGGRYGVSSMPGFVAGSWYMRPDGPESDMRTGEQSETTCHVKGFSPANERALWELVTRKGY